MIFLLLIVDNFNSSGVITEPECPGKQCGILNLLIIYCGLFDQAL